MAHAARWTLSAAALGTVLGAGCNTVFGIDELTYDGDGAANGTAARGASGGHGGQGVGGQGATGTGTPTGTATGTATGTSTGTCSGALCGEVCCDPGEVCDSQDVCCAPLSCQGVGVECGTHQNGCDGELLCGTCGDDEYCLDGQTCSPVSFRFETVPNGVFTMGSPPSEPGRNTYTGPNDELDETAHQVTLTRSFAITDREITQDDFDRVMGYNPSYFTACGDSCPVEYLTWDEAAAFCNELSEAKELAPCFACQGSGANVSCQLSSQFSTPYDCEGYRLPTEAEWERAARGGTQSAFHTGPVDQLNCGLMDASLGPIGWYIANSPVGYAGSVEVDCDGSPIQVGPHGVGQKAANAYDLHDMAGNVWEWVFGCPGPYSSSAVIDPIGSLSCSDEYKLYRGGGIGNGTSFCRHAERAAYAYEGHNIDIGFRPARTLP